MRERRESVRARKQEVGITSAGLGARGTDETLCRIWKEFGKKPAPGVLLSLMASSSLLSIKRKRDGLSAGVLLSLLRFFCVCDGDGTKCNLLARRESLILKWFQQSDESETK